MSGKIGDSNKSRKISNIHIGVDNTKRKVLKGWIGDANNVPQPIYSSYKPPAFASASYEEIAEALEMHYAGKINLADCWKVGDRREWYDGKVTIVDFNHYERLYPRGKRDKAGLVLLNWDYAGSVTKRTMNSASPASNSGGYPSSSMRTSMTEGFTNTDKTMAYYNNRYFGGSVQVKMPYTKTAYDTGVSYSYEYAFPPSEYEIIGEVKNAVVQEGTQLEYYKTPANRILSANGTTTTYWTRSQRKNTTDQYVYVESNGTVTKNFGVQATQRIGWAYLFCL